MLHLNHAVALYRGSSVLNEGYRQCTRTRFGSLLRRTFLTWQANSKVLYRHSVELPSRHSDMKAYVFASQATLSLGEIVNPLPRLVIWWRGHLWRWKSALRVDCLVWCFEERVRWTLRECSTEIRWGLYGVYASICIQLCLWGKQVFETNGCSPWNRFQRKLKPNEQTLISLEMKWNPPDTLASVHVAFSLVVGETPSPVLNCTVYVGIAQHRDNVKGDTDAKWLQNVKNTHFFPFTGLLLWMFYRYLCNIVCWVFPHLFQFELSGRSDVGSLFTNVEQKMLAHTLQPWSWRQRADCQA